MLARSLPEKVVEEWDMHSLTLRKFTAIGLQQFLQLPSNPSLAFPLAGLAALNAAACPDTLCLAAAGLFLGGRLRAAGLCNTRTA